VEFFFYSSLLFIVLFIAIFIPGQLMARRAFPSASPPLQVLLSFPLGCMLALLCTLPLTAFGVGGIAQQMVLLVIVSSCLFVWVFKGYYRELTASLGGVFVWWSYMLLALALLAFPSGEVANISHSLSSRIFNLPTDSFIPYNTARYLVEQLDPATYPVVPGWELGDRGPLAGVIIAYIFYLLNLQETMTWLGTSPGLGFIASGVSVFLNASVLFTMWIVVRHFVNSGAAYFAALLMGSTYFFLVNIGFSWPKFFMATWVLVGLAIFLIKKAPARRDYFLSGLCFGVAYLAHDSALFSVAAAGVYLLVSAFRKSNTGVVSTIGMLSLGVLLPVLPWLTFRYAYLPTTTHGPYYLLFCTHELNAVVPPFLQALSAYVAQYSWLELLSLKFGNIVYPFNPIPLGSLFFDADTSYLHALNHAHGEVFYRFISGVGLPAALLLCILLLKRPLGFQNLAPFFVIGLLSVAVAGIVAGCENGTILHVCGYLLFASFFMFLAPLFKRLDWISACVVGIHLGLNGVIAYLFLFYHSDAMLFRHAQTPYLVLVGALAMLFFVGCLLGMMNNVKDEA